MTTQAAQLSQVQDLSAAFAHLVSIAAPSVVAVNSAHSRSSGFFWSSGLIVTAEEALAEEGDFTVALPSGESFAARLVGRDHTTDIAVLRVERSDLPPVQMEKKTVPVGALAVAVGAQTVRQPQPWASYPAVQVPGGPSVAARSMLGSNLICACDRVLKAVSPLMQAAGRSA